LQASINDLPVRNFCCAVIAFFAFGSSAFAGSYYVDCSISGNGIGRFRGTLDKPWNNLTTVSTRTFLPGDTIFLKRGTTCTGMLAPRGSGAAGAPISIEAYGSGPRPIIDAGTSAAAIQLFNQSYWVIRDIETTGGNPHGIHISGNAAGTLSYFRISNLSVHDVGGSATTKWSGLIDISPQPGSATIIDDVIVDGVTVYNTEQWMGIHVTCQKGIVPAPNPNSIIIRNSRASNVAGDGITIYACSKGLLENNVSYDVGNVPYTAVGLPNAIWTFACADCVVQFNEGYRSHSPARDGGIFDIDFGSSNTTLQYNYGHDADGYCIAILGAFNLVTTNSIVRYNICANNGQLDPYFQGDIFFATWAGGSIDGVEIYNNTFFWNPTTIFPNPAVPFASLFNRNATLEGTRPRFFRNNIIYSTGAPFITTDANLTLDNNLYWTTSGAPQWHHGSGTWTSLASFQSETGQEAQGLYADPLLAAATDPFDGRSITGFKLRSDSPAIDRGAVINSMAGRDFFGVTVPQGLNVDIGASEYASSGGLNLIVNPGFETDLAGTQTPSGWSTWSLAGDDYADYTDASGGAHSGTFHGTHWVESSSYDVFTYQVVPDLAPGTYQLSAWVKSSGGQSVAWMEVNAYGGAKRPVSISASPTWTRVILSDIAVTAGQARIGFYSIATAGQWLHFDDVSFARQADGDPLRHQH